MNKCSWEYMKLQSQEMTHLKFKQNCHWSSTLHLWSMFLSFWQGDIFQSQEGKILSWNHWCLKLHLYNPLFYKVKAIVCHSLTLCSNMHTLPLSRSINYWGNNIINLCVSFILNNKPVIQLSKCVLFLLVMSHIVLGVRIWHRLMVER